MTLHSARAQVWTEVGDAGDLPGTAQSPIWIGSSLTITGTFSGTVGGPDMYLLPITSPGTFSATVTAGPNTQVFLFTTSGLGIAFNDDASGPLSALPMGNPLYAALPPGHYLLAISASNADPSSAPGMIFPDTPSGVFSATGPGGGSFITGWSTSSMTGTYSIHFTGVSIPAPPGIGMLVLAGLARRRRRVA